MPSSQAVRVKICGPTRLEEALQAVEAGASYIGLVFFPPSPRALTPEQALPILQAIPEHVTRVALTVDAEDALIDTLARLPLDMLQLHGWESPQRVAQLRARLGLPMMKAIGVRTLDDLDQVPIYAGVADQILIDAKAPEGASRPGGNALAFDWNLIAGYDWPCPWMLAGGLTPDNAAEAVARTGARQLDVSSGVESTPGRKDPALMRAFVAAARHAAPSTRARLRGS
ncbi:MAG: phosphoribosylanthranilate isomerase [Pseudomonadota bacterium]